MNDEKKQITEKDKDVIDAWFEKAKTVTKGDLPGFFEHVVNGFSHDYGTICHALAACAVAACWAANREPGARGDITGFQAGAVMWTFVQRWMHEKGPMTLVKYENMLYPQYARVFEREISPETWQWLQDEAKKKLKVAGDAHPEVLRHWRSIVDGQVPFGFAVVKE